uniref:Disease resistance R13L4/SHOC-2-like LRR domain-containing protein n=1 Tax=Leersia perrieri TaxID=77586 RepID=A0A0D9XS84_9ORYZ
MEMVSSVAYSVGSTTAAELQDDANSIFMGHIDDGELYRTPSKASTLPICTRMLHVLDLEDTDDLVTHHLEHIGKLFRLKYLSLRRCNGIFKLPDSLGNLKQLETLNVRDKGGVTLVAVHKYIAVVFCTRLMALKSLVSTAAHLRVKRGTVKAGVMLTYPKKNGAGQFMKMWREKQKK